MGVPGSNTTNEDGDVDETEEDEEEENEEEDDDDIQIIETTGHMNMPRGKRLSATDLNNNSINKNGSVANDSNKKRPDEVNKQLSFVNSFSPNFSSANTISGWV